MKDFFDRSYYPVLGRINGRPYGLFVRQAARIATGWRLRAVVEPLITQTPEAILAPKVIAANDLGKCRTLAPHWLRGSPLGLF
jgi:hypothetical protein